MTDIFTLGLKADTKDIDRGSKRLDDFADSAENADKKTSQLRDGVNTAGKAIAAFGLTAATALGAVTVAAGNNAREIQKLARLSGANVDEFQRMAFAAQAFGIEQDKLSDILKDTQDKVGDFLNTGGGELADFFEKIAPAVGVTAENFRGLNGKDALQLYVSTLEKANLSQAEMVFFMESIADEATLLTPLLANNGAEFKRLGDRADELGIILDGVDFENLNDMKTSLSELNAITTATGNVIGATLAPFIKALSDDFIENAATGDTVRETMTTLIEVGVRVAGVFADAGRVFEIFGTGLAATAFTLVETFDTAETRLELFGVAFALTFEELRLDLKEWVNEQRADLAAWATDMANAADFLDLFDDIKFEPNVIDTTQITAAIDTLKAEQASLEFSLVDSNARIADAWQDVVDLMMMPLPSEGMDAWADAIIVAVEAQRELQKAIEDTGKSSTKVVGTAGSDAVKWINNTKEVTKGFTAAFGENEAVAKRVHQVNLAIGIAEQAMILNNVIAGTAATQVHLANSALKASANAVEAVTAAATAPFPVGFAAAAAMIGLMTSLVGTFGSSGGGGFSDPTEGRQAEQGTGTVLGSGDKSASIINAQGRFEDISIDQLSELRQIRDSNNLIAHGIETLSTSIVAGGIGGFEGSLEEGVESAQFEGFTIIRRRIVDEGIIFIGQTLGEILEGGVTDAFAFFDVEEIATKGRGFGKTGSIQVREEVTTETQALDAALSTHLAGIFRNIGDTIQASAEALSLDVEGAMNTFEFDVGRISLEGLDGEGIRAELEAVFSAQADLAAEFLVEGLGEFQRIGEGLFETLTRVTGEQVLFNDAVRAMGFDLSTLSGIMQIEIGQAILDLAGGAERFGELTKTFFSEFFTDAEQFEQLTSSLTEAVDGLGLSMFDTRDGFRATVEGLDLTTNAGRELFTALLELAPAMDDYFDVLDNDAATAAAEAERELEDARRDAVAATRDAEREAIAATRDAEREAATATRETEAAARELAATLAAVAREMEAVTQGLETALTSAFSEIGRAVAVEQDALKAKLDGDLSDIESLFEASRVAVGERIAQQVDTMGAQLDLVNDRAGALSSLSDVLGSASSQVLALTREQSRAAIQAAIGGGTDLADADLRDAVTMLSRIAESDFGSSIALQREQARTSAQLAELKDITDDELSLAEQNALMIESQIEAIERTGESQIEALNMAQVAAEVAAQERFDDEFAILDQTLAVAQQQLDTLLGIDSSILSLTETLAQFTAASAALAADSQQAPTALSMLQAQNAAAAAEGVPQLSAVVNTATTTGTAGAFSAEDTLKAIAVSTAKSAKLLTRWDGDGQPEIRDVS